ncbi:uncharacterized protein LOC111679222 [Lucilia cuprina]|uniref:uncharacterized protein LOC111679222 n=1 Tax=Lucilia cuprina TaxID=7375 RepID=UPI001F068163|nr:uncharacterized protein LOC111679222 [Lucilia cuprina]
MSDVKKDDVKLKYIPNATTITNKQLGGFPNVKHFLQNLVKNTVVVSKQVGRSFQYNAVVEKNRYFSAHGLFMDYFIRKHLSNQYNIEISDSRTEHILENPDDYIIGKDIRLQNSIREHYEIFKDPNTKAMNIINSIKIVSQSHLIFFGYGIPRRKYNMNTDNLREIIRYLESLPYKTVDLNPMVGCEYFNADADLIFDNDVIYEIKTSKFKSLQKGKAKIPLSKFYQTIVYSFGFYRKTGIKIKKFKIYNPLLGDEYSIELQNIDFKLFEKVLKHDVIIYSNLEEILAEEMVLDPTLFPEEDEK